MAMKLKINLLNNIVCVYENLITMYCLKKIDTLK